MRMQRGPAPSGMRDEMEKRLTPLIKCVLRTGGGMPELVRWVRNTLPQLPAASHEQTAPRMARLLCAELLSQNKPTDTVVGRRSAETIAAP